MESIVACESGLFQDLLKAYVAEGFPSRALMRLAMRFQGQDYFLQCFAANGRSEAMLRGLCRHHLEECREWIVELGARLGLGKQWRLEAAEELAQGTGTRAGALALLDGMAWTDLALWVSGFASDDNGQVRAMVARLLRKALTSGDRDRVVPMLELLVGDPEWGVREQAIDALLPSSMLLAMIERDPVVRVCDRAVQAIAEQVQSGVGRLADVLGSGPVVRELVRRMGLLRLWGMASGREEERDLSRALLRVHLDVEVSPDEARAIIDRRRLCKLCCVLVPKAFLPVIDELAQKVPQAMVPLAKVARAEVLRALQENPSELGFLVAASLERSGQLVWPKVKLDGYGDIDLSGVSPEYLMKVLNLMRHRLRVDAPLPSGVLQGINVQKPSSARILASLVEGEQFPGVVLSRLVGSFPRETVGSFMRGVACNMSAFNHLWACLRRWPPSRQVDLLLGVEEAFEQHNKDLDWLALFPIVMLYARSGPPSEEARAIFERCRRLVPRGHCIEEIVAPLLSFCADRSVLESGVAELAAALFDHGLVFDVCDQIANGTRIGRLLALADACASRLGEGRAGGRVVGIRQHWLQLS
jgi:hypothetical protein